jgi:hypothetical protein
MKRLSLIAIFAISRDDRAEFFIPLSQLNLVAINVASGHALLGIVNLTGVRFRHLSLNQAKSCASDLCQLVHRCGTQLAMLAGKMSWRGMWNRSAVGSWMDTKRRMRLMGILRPVVAALPAACRSPRGSCKFISAAWAAGKGPRSLNAKHIERGAYRLPVNGLIASIV